MKVKYRVTPRSVTHPKMCRAGQEGGFKIYNVIHRVLAYQEYRYRGAESGEVAQSIAVMN